MSGTGNRGRGRPKGSRNKITQGVQDLLAEKFPGYDPVIAMASIAHDPESDPQMVFNAHKEVAKYTRPQLKAVDLTSTGGGIHLTWDTGIDRATPKPGS